MTAAAVETKPRVVLIDLSSLFWSAWHSSGNDAVSMARERTLDAVRRVVGDSRPLVAICCDSGRSFRKDLAPEYKAQRPEKDHASLGELDRTKDRLRADGYLLWEAKGFEADDIIATATQAARANGHDVLIASADKDLLQLCGGGVRQLRTHTWKEGGASEVMTDFGVGPSQFGDWLALVGDKSDNITGAPGVGPKTATALLRQFTNLETIYITLATNPKAITDTIGRNAQAILTSLKESKAAVALARNLVTLRDDVPIDWTQIYKERRPQALTTFEDEPPAEDEDLEARNGVVAPSPQRAVASSSEERDQTPSEARRESSGPGGADAPFSTAKSDMANEPTASAPDASNDNTIAISELVPLEPQKTTHIVPKASAQFEQQLEPASLKEAYWLAQGLYESRVYTKWTSPHAMWLAIIRGREMGFPAAISLDLFHPMEGGLALKSNTIQTLAERLPDCEYMRCIHSDDKCAEWETKHRKHKEPTKLRYTIDEAVQAGLCGFELVPPPKPGQKDSRSNWEKRRQNMLRKTARDNLIAMVYPTAKGGLYSAEELGADVND
jgi:5'-3' exonuclease